MQLKLTYHPTQKHTVAAAILAGDDPTAWLSEISQWGISVSELDAYILPTSKQSVKAAGLLVVFKYPNAAAKLSLLQPYRCVGQRLFLPMNAMLEPAILESEWNELLLHHLQVFHPTIGMVGFAEADKIALPDLLQLTECQPTFWDLANVGQTENPPLTRVGMPEPLMDKLFADLAKNMDLKPLEDIPNDDKKGDGASDLADKIGKSILGSAAGLAGALGNLLGGAGGGGQGQQGSGNQANGGGTAGDAGGGLLGGFMNWAAQKMADLERKRNDEINRLMDMFDKDMDEALKYALPLDSPYQDRGTAPPSNQLGQQNTDFNLGGIGGGRAADNWQLDWQRRETLRKKYLAAAQEQIKRGDFRKAAYIYAKLLGDLHAAANVLKQGKHYREAALLYRDHLKNDQQAAECFELGGHWTEALKLYEKLENYEKIGDIYKNLEQPDLANAAYEKVVEKLLTKRDYVGAGQIILQKIEDEERAATHYLEGWQQDAQAEVCLKKYFTLLAGEGDKIAEKIDLIYQKHTPKRLQFNFLAVLKEVKNRERHAAISTVSESIAYEVVSQKAAAGDLSKLHLLNDFVEADLLLERDCQRYVVWNRNRPIEHFNKFDLIKSEHLPNNIRYRFAKDFKNEIFGWGFLQEKHPIVFRFNWNLEIEKLGFNQLSLTNGYHRFIMDSYHSYRIFTRDYSKKFSTIDFNQTTGFYNSIKIENIQQYNQPYAVCLDKHELTTVLRRKPGRLGAYSLEKYDINGHLENVISISPQPKNTLNLKLDKWVARQMFSRNGFYFVKYGNQILQISQEGDLKSFDVKAPVFEIHFSDIVPFNQILVSTTGGFLLFQISMKGLEQIGSFFAKYPSFIKFIGTKMIAIAKGKSVEFYQLNDSNLTPKLVHTIYLSEKVVGILKPPKRNQMAVLTDDGGLHYYQYQ